MVPFPYAWRRVLLWARLVFAAAGLASALLLSPNASHAKGWAAVASGVYLFLGLLVPLRKRSGGAFALLILFGDVVYFLVLVSTGTGSVVWLPAFFYLYVLAEAVFVYRALRGFCGGGGERDLLRRGALGRCIPDPPHHSRYGCAGVRVLGL
jgi:hypothetical protein